MKGNQTEVQVTPTAGVHANTSLITGVRVERATAADHRMTENQGSSPSETGGDKEQKGQSGSRCKSRRNNRPNRPRVVKFEGSAEDLKGHIFDCSGHIDTANLFTKTKQKMEVCAGIQCGGVMAAAVEKLVEPKVPATPDPPGHARGDADPWKAVDTLDKHRWETKEKEAAKKESAPDTQNQKLCSVVIGQCTEAIIARIESSKPHGQVSKDRTSMALLKTIQSIVLDIQDQTCVAQTVHIQKRQLHKMAQGQHETVPQHFERFQNKVEAITQVGGSFGFQTRREGSSRKRSQM